MSESTLAAGYDSLRSLIGYKLGYGRTSAAWTSANIADIAQCLLSALRSFYWPTNGYEFTFLKPVKQFSSATGVRQYDCPDDFAGMDGDIQWVTDSAPSWSIKRVEHEHLRRKRQGLTISTGRPECFALVPLAPKGANSSRWQFEFDRAFDATYVLQYQYDVIPDQLITGQMPYGGAQHTETIIAACLAAAEWQIDSQLGLEHEKFQQRLAASIAADSRLRPTRMGPYGQDGAELCAAPRGHTDLYYGTTNLDAA